MIISGYKPNNPENFSSKTKLENKQISFTSVPKYKVVNTNAFKKVLPAIAFAGSVLGCLGYLVGGTGLFYDFYKENQNKSSEKKDLHTSNKRKKAEEGVKTITTNTEFGKVGLICGKAACSATAIAGMACGLGEGLPLMAIGEATNLSSSRILETPVGTGLFGIGIASIFAGLALDNTPNLKLNELDVMAEENIGKKAQMILKNMVTTGKEISKSIFEIISHVFDPKFIKENILQGTPKNVVFSEAINEKGKVFITKALRHNKNYMMNAASFTLALGGLGIIASSFLDAKKAQKASLKIEESGFIFDNIGITRYGLDKLTTNGKGAGASFAIGGIINAISQFIGLDNKEGRALQWLGISGVFLGFAIDRGKHLKTTLELAKQRPELTRVIREWKFDLSKLVKDKTELKNLQKEIKMHTDDNPIKNKEFLKLEADFKKIIGETYQSTECIKEKLELKLGDISSNFKSQKVADFEKTKNVLEICTEKMFGSKNPKAIDSKAA